MKTYLELLRHVALHGVEKQNRTGINTISITGAMLQHDMSTGFPLLTTKRMSLRTIAVELESFIKGNRSKKWLQERGCNIWNQWSNPMSRPYDVTQEDHDDLGPIYGVEWRDFNGEGIDQLKNIMNTLAINPDSRRMLVTAWNPIRLDQAALPPCHFAFQLVTRGEYLDLVWYQRSADMFIGAPYDLASYGLLLRLICKQSGYKAGTLTGFLADTHIYINHLSAVKEQLSRNPLSLPDLYIYNKPNEEKFDLFNFDALTDLSLAGYTSHPAIKAKVAV